MYEADKLGAGLRPVGAHHSCGCMVNGGDVMEAGRGRCSPDPGLWPQHMRNGDFEAAWAASDAVLEARRGTTCHHLPRHEQWIWDGTPLAGRRVLIRCYHGLGDTLQFIRYAPMVKEVASEVIVWAQPKLIPLLRTAPGIDKLMPLHDGTPDARYDMDVELMELPHVFRTTLRDLPREVPYIHPKPLAGGNHATMRQDGRLHLGIAWRSGDWDARRSIPLALLARIAEMPGIVLHILQFGPGLEELPDGFGVRHEVGDMSKLAAVMCTLDLVVTVDSMPAHLAGALGTPVWTLLHTDPDWRWMAGREDSAWYPTMRLFRQERPGEWGAVVARVIKELERIAVLKSVPAVAAKVRAGLFFRADCL